MNRDVELTYWQEKRDKANALISRQKAHIHELEILSDIANEKIKELLNEAKRKVEGL